MDSDGKKGIMIVILIVLVLIIVGTLWWAVSAHNTMVRNEEAVDSQWAQVTNEYQRKIDLIPELVNVTSGYQEFEATTLSNITELRTRWMEATTTEEQVNATNQLDLELKTIILTYESYPYLESVTVVKNLMYNLEGTENRIATERMRYNEEVQKYNSHIKSFPASMLTGWGDFEERSYYQSENAPPPP